MASLQPSEEQESSTSNQATGIDNRLSSEQLDRLDMDSQPSQSDGEQRDIAFADDATGTSANMSSRLAHEVQAHPSPTDESRPSGKKDEHRLVLPLGATTTFGTAGLSLVSNSSAVADNPLESQQLPASGDQVAYEDDDTIASALISLEMALANVNDLGDSNVNRLYKLIFTKAKNFTWTKGSVEALPNREKLLSLLANSVKDALEKDKKNAKRKKEKIKECDSKLRAINCFIKEWSSSDANMWQRYGRLAQPRTIRSWMDLAAWNVFNYLVSDTGLKANERQVTMGSILMVLEGHVRGIFSMVNSSVRDEENVLEKIQLNLRGVLQKVPIERWRLLHSLRKDTNTKIHDRELPLNNNGERFIVYPDEDCSLQKEAIIEAIRIITTKLKLFGGDLVVELQSQFEWHLFETCS